MQVQVACQWLRADTVREVQGHNPDGYWNLKKTQGDSKPLSWSPNQSLSNNVDPSKVASKGPYSGQIQLQCLPAARQISAECC